jgi:carboxymethylenebutenolidase
MGEIINFKSNGSDASGYFAASKQDDAKSVIVIQEWWGLVDHIKDVCDRFADAGFNALAPDLYNGKVVKEPDEAAKEMMALKLQDASKIMSGAVDELISRTHSEKVGVTGFCMGGGLALVLACNRPDVVTAVVPFYGVIPWENAQPDYSKLSANVLGHFAEKDGFFTPELVRQLEDTLNGLNKQNKLIIYEGVEHAFFNDTRPEVFNKQAAELAWSRTLEFFNENI